MAGQNTQKPSSLLHSLLSFVKKLLQVFTVLLRYIWLFFPAFLFLILAYFCFWHLSQGRDLLISGIEGGLSKGVLLIALIFWVFTTWYSSRILVYKRDSLFHCGKDFYNEPPAKAWNIDWILYKCSEVVGFHLPRLMGYLCFALIALAYAQLPFIKLPAGGALLLLVLYLLLYMVLTPLFDSMGSKIAHKDSGSLLRTIYWATLVVFLLLIVAAAFIIQPIYNPLDVSLYRR